jgi:hypothetical protein
MQAPGAHSVSQWYSDGIEYHHERYSPMSDPDGLGKDQPVARWSEARGRAN